MGDFKELFVYKKAFDLCLEIFEVSKRFPDDEKFALTSQIRRSSRSVGSNVAEGYRKRRYPANYISKLTDADMENAETTVWLDIAFRCNYINAGTHESLTAKTVEIGRLRSFMMSNPKKFC
jgi:four helix bundle protein